jgi:membrane fusion protein (multidrug efflux system)
VERAGRRQRCDKRGGENMANGIILDLDQSRRIARRAVRAALNRHREHSEDEHELPSETYARRHREEPERDDHQEAPSKPAEEETQNKDDEEEQKRPGFLRRHPFLTTVGAVALLLAVGAGYVYWDYSSHFETTDDAFIAARQFAIAPKVGGYVTNVPVTDNQHVEVGQLIAQIDQRDYRAALDQADAQVASSRANVQDLKAKIEIQYAQIVQAQAQLEQARAALKFSEEQASRYDSLAKTGAGTVQNAQQYTSSLDQQRATVKTSEAAVTSAQRQIPSLDAQVVGAEASVKQAEAQRDQAKLNLGYTAITADQPGRVVQLTAGVGEYAAAGTDLSMFVPDELWVVANFKENQLDRMRPGQPLTLRIDAYPERKIRGHVASVQPGSGTAFSLLPAQNATGNYVKITQRVPVKVVLDEVPTDVTLGPGMSVEPTVRVDPSPSLYEKWRAWL